MKDTVIRAEKMKEYKHRYDRNLIISKDEQSKLKEKRIAVLGAGGLGGYVIEMTARMGVGELLIFDFDDFSESNLNRQIFATEKNLGNNKAFEAKKRLSEINSETKVEIVTEKLNKGEITARLEGCDVVVDCLDTVRDKLLLQRIAKELDMPMIHGAIGGWFGQVTTIMPGNDTLDIIYPDGEEPDNSDGNPSFTPAIIAGFQVSEVIKVLLGYEDILQRKLLAIDLFSNEVTIVSL